MSQSHLKRTNYTGKISGITIGPSIRQKNQHIRKNSESLTASSAWSMKVRRPAEIIRYVLYQTMYPREARDELGHIYWVICDTRL